MKVLVTDDAADFRLYLRVLLQRWGYQVVEAADGQEALACLEANDIRLVVSDWMMPGMSGPDLCRAARATDLGHYVYIILLTGRSDSADLVEGLDAGADDFVTKPFEAQVLRARLRVGERILALEQRLADQNHDLQESRNQLAKAYNQIQADLAIAARIQRQLLPTNDLVMLPCRAQWLFLPAAQVSGDSFNFFELTPDLVGFYHLDISGHGVPAALLSVSLNHALVPGGGFGVAGTDFLDPALFLADLNRQLTSRDGEVQNYATIAYGTLERETGRIRLALAGHPYPILIRQSGSIDYLRQGGLPVGMFPHVEYDTQELLLNPGDRLLFYSDGISECSNPSGEAFGEQRFRETLAQAIHGLGGTPSLATALERGLRAWRGSSDFEDDISMLALERPLAVREETLRDEDPLTNQTRDPPMNPEDPLHPEGALQQDGPRGPGPTHFLVQSDAEGLADLQSRLLDLCNQDGLDEMAGFKLTCAIIEALNNCIEHAYSGESGHPIDLIWTRNPEEVAIEIRDQGHPMPDMTVDTSPMPGSDAESGRGWHIIREWTDSVSYSREPQHNVLTLTHRLP